MTDTITTAAAAVAAIGCLSALPWTGYATMLAWDHTLRGASGNQGDEDTVILAARCACGLSLVAQVMGLAASLWIAVG